jgi:hypothetical protein
MSGSNPFLVDPVASIEPQSAEPEVDVATLNDEPSSASEPEVDAHNSDFWGESSDSEDSDSDASDSSSDAAEDAPQPGQAGTIKYKANGEEKEATAEEAKKALELVSGARKAMTEASKVRKELAGIKKQNTELAEYKQVWDKLESIKDDKRQLVELITGQSYENFLDYELERREIYRDASPAEQRAMDAEDKLQRMEREIQKREEEKNRNSTEAETREYNADKKLVQGQLEREFALHDFPSDNPQVSNRLKKMLWRDAVADLKVYHSEYGKITQKMISKAFGDSANALKYLYSNSVDKAVNKQSAEKKVEATQKAQAASTKNYRPEVKDEWKKMNPMDLFRSAVQKRK